VLTLPRSPLATNQPTNRYDPNWHIGIPAPFHLEGHVWGAHVYWSALAHYNALHPSGGASGSGGGGRYAERPLLLGMADASHPAAHRYPVWWTGDGKSLSYSVRSMVQLGVTLLKPYVHSDCGGNADRATGLVPVPEYVRWSQHCALGAIFRYHGRPGHQPWLYDNATGAIVRSFLGMRMALMPTLLAAGAAATADGTPIARRLDIAFPGAQHRANATRLDQYLLGDDLLVAPFTSYSNGNGDDGGNGTQAREVWVPPGAWQDAWTGEVLTGPALVTSTQPLARLPMWHRRGGGLVVTAPTAARSVATQDWGVLGLELFPFGLAGEEGGRGTGARVLRRTLVREGEEDVAIIATQSAIGGRVTLAIEPAGVGAACAARRWRLRINLLPQQAVLAWSADGGAPRAPSRVLGPLPRANAASFVPFAGGAPPSAAGAVVELHLSPAPGRRLLEFEITHT